MVRQTPASRPAFAVVAVLILGWFGGLAWQQVQFWRDSTTLYSRALSVTAENHLAHKGLADAMLAENRLDGLTLEFPQWRFNLRKSNTEPVTRLNVESRGDRALMQAKTRELLALIEGAH